MKQFIFMALILQFMQPAMASEHRQKGLKKPAVKKSQLGTSFKFDGSTLRGKYQNSMNTAATVENDKLLEDLLKGRTEFNDRLEEEKERN